MHSGVSGGVRANGRTQTVQTCHQARVSVPGLILTIVQYMALGLTHSLSHCDQESFLALLTFSGREEDP